MIWSYARGSGLSKVGETAIDVIGYAAQIAAQLGAHIIKVKLPNEHVEQDAARKVYEQEQIPIATLSERVHHVVQCAFNGRRIVIFSGGPIDSDDASSMKFVPLMPDMDLVRLSDAILSSVPSQMHCDCSTQSWIFTVNSLRPFALLH